MSEQAPERSIITHLFEMRDNASVLVVTPLNLLGKQDVEDLETAGVTL